GPTRDTVCATGHDVDPVGLGADLDRQGAIGRGPIAKLALVVRSPAPQRAIRSRRAGVSCARTDLVPGRGTDLRQSGLIGEVPVADLPIGVRSPAPQRVVIADRTVVRPANGDLQPGRVGADGDRYRLRARRAVAELAMRIGTPASQRTIGHPAARMRGAST